MVCKVGDLLAGWRDGELIIGYIESIGANFPDTCRVCWLPPNEELSGEFKPDQIMKLRKVYEEHYEQKQ